MNYHTVQKFYVEVQGHIQEVKFKRVKLSVIATKLTYYKRLSSFLCCKSFFTYKVVS